jgi:hypothetical protein
MSWWGGYNARERLRALEAARGRDARSQQARVTSLKLRCAACGRRGALLQAIEGKRTCRYCGAVTGPQGPEKEGTDGTQEG